MSYNETRLNRKRKASIKAIKSAFIALLEQMPFERISVTRICEKADVNRATFYSNFEDIFALVKSIEDDIYELIGKTYENYCAMDEYQFYLEMFKMYNESPEYSVIDLLPDTGFKEKMNRMIYDHVVGDRLSSSDCLDAQLLECSYQYVYAGTQMLVSSWLEGGKKISPEIMAKYLYELNTACIGISDPDKKFKKPTVESADKNNKS